MDPIYISGSRSWGMRGFLLAFLGRLSEWLGARCGRRMGLLRSILLPLTRVSSLCVCAWMLWFSSLVCVSSSFYVDFFSITTILDFIFYTEYIHIND